MELGEHRVVVEVPASDDVCGLDDDDSPQAVLDLLTGDAYDDLLDLLDEMPAAAMTELADEVARHFAVLHRPPAGITAVVDDLNRYGPGLEFDLAERGLDLHDWVRDPARHPWAKLLRLADRLPPGSHYAAARALDVDLATEIALARREKRLPPPSKAPALEGWTAEVSLLQQVVDVLRGVEHAVWGASPKFKGKGGTPPKPGLRPRTAADTVRTAEQLAQHDTLASQLLGDRYRPPSGPRLPSVEAVRGAVLLDPT